VGRLLSQNAEKMSGVELAQFYFTITAGGAATIIITTIC
jgi:hypothetical protein